VASPGGLHTAFSRDKLLLSLHSCLKHRKTALEDASALSETVIQKLLTHVDDGTLDAKQISSTVSVVLARFDKPASVAYQAFHP
jgi:transcriptional regulator NrdR family protein